MPEAISISGTVTFTWALENATDDGCTIVDESGATVLSNPVVNGYEVPVTETETFTVRCDGYDATAPLEAQVYVPVLITAFGPESGPIDYDTSTSLVVGLDPSVTSCTLNDQTVTFLVGNRIAVGPLTASTPYLLTCVDGEGRESSAGTTVSVKPTVPVVRAESDGAELLLSWSVSENATSCTVAGAPPGPAVPVTNGEGELRLTTGAMPSTYTVTCSSDVAGDASDPVRVWWGDVDNEEDLTPLNDVSIVMGVVRYEGTAMTSARLQPLSALVEANEVRFESVVELLRIELPSLRVVHGDLFVGGVPEMTELVLPALETVEGELTVQSNIGLTDVLAEALVTVGHSVWIEDNRLLQSLQGFPCLELVEGEAFLVEANPEVSCAEIEVVYCALSEEHRPEPVLNPACPGINQGCTTSAPLLCSN